MANVDQKTSVQPTAEQLRDIAEHSFGIETLREGQLSEVYYPDLGTPALRDMEFVVTDGRGFVERSTQADSSTVAPDPKVPAYRQEDTSPSGRSLFNSSSVFLANVRRQSFGWFLGTLL